MNWQMVIEQLEEVGKETKAREDILETLTTPCEMISARDARRWILEAQTTIYQRLATTLRQAQEAPCDS